MKYLLTFFIGLFCTLLFVSAQQVARDKVVVDRHRHMVPVVPGSSTGC
jgi:hypothetical protein